MVKLTNEQKAMLEALDNMSDEEIDYSDIPPITDWSGFRMGLFYRPKWKDITLILDEYITDWFEGGESLGEAVNKALSSEVYRMKFPVRVERTEEIVRWIKQAPEKVTELPDWQKDQIKALCNMPIEEAAFSDAPLKPTGRSKAKTGTSHRPAIKEINLKLNENIIDWFEERLEEGQPLDEAINKALMDHIRWVSSHSGAQRKEKPVRQAENPA